MKHQAVCSRAVFVSFINIRPNNLVCVAIQRSIKIIIIMYSNYHPLNLNDSIIFDLETTYEISN